MFFGVLFWVAWLVILVVVRVVFRFVIVCLRGYIE